MKKLDIMNMRDGKDTLVGEKLPWQIVDGKITKIEKKEVVKEEVKIEPKKEIRIQGPDVQLGIKEIKIVEKKKKKVKK